MSLNVINAVFPTDTNIITTEPIWQYSYGQILNISGIELPEYFEVQFSNVLFGGESKTQIGHNNQVEVLDEYLTTGKPVFAWIVLHEGADDGGTEYQIKIPIRRRSEPTDEEPTPEEQSVITQTIAALQDTVAELNTIDFHIDSNGCLILTKGAT